MIATKRWIGLVLVLLGLALAGIGAYNWHLLLASSADAGRTYLAKTVALLVAGFWLFIGGAYWIGSPA